MRDQFLPPKGSRIAVVGSCGGIGAAVVEALLEAQCNVIGLDLQRSIDQTSPAIPTIAFDGRDIESVDAAFAKLEDDLSGLDGMVVTSGFTSARLPMAEMAVSDIDDILQGNLRLTALVIRAAEPLLRKAKAASVVLMSSDMAYIPQPGYATYVATKAGVAALGQSFAKEVAPDIRVNIVSPGAVDTPFLRGGMGRSDTPDAPLRFDMDSYLAQVPLGRLAVAEDIVGPIIFLLGHASQYMTGQVLHVSGGALMR